jgi:hypothetical protein
MPSPHLDKLVAAIENEKMPEADKARLEASRLHYDAWIANMDAVTGTPEEVLTQLIALLNNYKFRIDVELIFDSEGDFLYRQKGQLKLDNSVIEEFLPRLIGPRVIPELAKINLVIGPTSSYSSLFFDSSLDVPRQGGGPNVRTKDQDFAISKPLYIRTSHSPNFEAIQTENKATTITYVAAECKTNLDKTMFQEACSTARDTKFAVAGARYYLLAEWLDMTPLSTAATDIDEVLILRKARRLGANVRAQFGTSRGRRAQREAYVAYLEAHPLSVEVFQRFVNHIRGTLVNEAPQEIEVLRLGYF